MINWTNQSGTPGNFFYHGIIADPNYKKFGFMFYICIFEREGNWACDVTLQRKFFPKAPNRRSLRKSLKKLRSKDPSVNLDRCEFYYRKYDFDSLESAKRHIKKKLVDLTIQFLQPLPEPVDFPGNGLARRVLLKNPSVINCITKKSNPYYHQKYSGHYSLGTIGL